MLPKNYSVIFAFYILYISRLYLQLRRHFELLCQPFIITCLVILPDLIPACLLLSQLPRLACTSACLLEHFSVPLPRPSCGLLFTCLPPRASRWVSDPVTIVTLSVNNRPEQHLHASTPIPHPSGTVILSHHHEATPPPPWPRLVPARLPLPEVSPGFQHPQLVQPERSVRQTTDQRPLPGPRGPGLRPFVFLRVAFTRGDPHPRGHRPRDGFMRTGPVLQFRGYTSVIRFCPKPHAFRPGGALSFETKDSPPREQLWLKHRRSPGRSSCFLGRLCLNLAIYPWIWVHTKLLLPVFHFFHFSPMFLFLFPVSGVNTSCYSTFPFSAWVMQTSSYRPCKDHAGGHSPRPWPTE